MPGKHSLEPFMRALEERDYQRSFLAGSLILDTDTFQTGDFIFNSGLSSPMKIECDNLRADPIARRRISEYLAEAIKLNPKRNGNPPDVVVGVISGGVLFAQEVAGILGAKFASRFGTRESPGTRERGYIRPGENVVIIEDAITTGGSTVACADRVWQEGGIPFMVATVFDYDFQFAREMLAANNLIDVNLVNFNSFATLLDKKRWESGAGIDEETMARIRHWHDVEAPAFFTSQTTK